MITVVLNIRVKKFTCSYYQKVIDNSESEDDKECFIKRKSFPFNADFLMILLLVVRLYCAPCIII